MVQIRLTETSKHDFIIFAQAKIEEIYYNFEIIHFTDFLL